MIRGADMPTASARGGSRRSRPGPVHLARPRLVSRLKQSVRLRLTVISAPAGYGKTALVDQWLAEHRGLPVGRVNFTATDDRRRVAAKLSAAIGELCSVRGAGKSNDPAAAFREL